MKKVLSLVLILVLVLSFVSCGKNTLEGVWEAKDDLELGLSITVEFTEDTMDMMGIVMDYTVKGDTLMLDFMGEEIEMEYDIDGDVLTLTVEGEAQEFTRVEE